MRKPELPALTGIRFYAALLVYLSHISVIPGGEALVGQKLLFNAGVVGVSFFFVLSGFILTYNYGDHFRHGVSGASYRRFIWDRLTKIYPVHFATFLMILPIQIFSPNLPLDWRAVPFHLLLVQCFWPFSNPTFYNTLNVPSWSISCEWFFYLLAPGAMFLVLGSKRHRWGFVTVVIGYVAVLEKLLSNSTDYTRLYFVSWFAPARFPDFVVGVLVAWVFVAVPAVRLARIAGFAQVAGAVCILAGAIYRVQAPWPLWGGLLYVPGSALLVLGLASGGGALTAHLSCSWLKRLGMASFSFYLIHAPILRAVKGVFYYLNGEIHSWPGFGAVAIGMFVFIQTVAFVVYRGYELPVQRCLRKLLRFSPTAFSVESVQKVKDSFVDPRALSHASTIDKSEARLDAGDWVEVKRPREIFETFDAEGTLDGLPFMPEMLEYCGRRFRVSRVAEKTCVEFPGRYWIREFRGNEVVLLEDLRCSGADHDGCGRACTLFWKAAWLRKVNAPEIQGSPNQVSYETVRGSMMTKTPTGQYICQSTALAQATLPLLRSRIFLKCLYDISSKSRGVFEMVRLVLAPLWRKATKSLPRRHLAGNLKRTPIGELHLEAGDWVKIKSAADIAQTLDRRGRNRGLSCDYGMCRYSGRKFRVRNRLDRMIAEPTGEMREVQGTVILEGLECGCFNVVGGCPRKEPVYWREIWLERSTCQPDTHQLSGLPPRQHVLPNEGDTQ